MPGLVQAVRRGDEGDGADGPGDDGPDGRVGEEEDGGEEGHAEDEQVGDPMRQGQKGPTRQTGCEGLPGPGAARRGRACSDALGLEEEPAEAGRHLVAPAVGHRPRRHAWPPRSCAQVPCTRCPRQLLVQQRVPRASVPHPGSATTTCRSARRQSRATHATADNRRRRPPPPFPRRTRPLR